MKKKQNIIFGVMFIFCLLLCVVFIASHNNGEPVELIGPAELKLYEGKEFSVIEVRSSWYNPKDNSIYLKHGDSTYLLQNVPELLYNDIASGKTIIIK